MFLPNGPDDPEGLFRRVFPIRKEFQGLGQILPVKFCIGFGNAGSHSVIEIGNTLPPVLVVLVGLDGDAGKGRIALDILWFPEMPVAGGKTMPEQFFDVDLAAGGGQGQKVHIVDMDVAVPVGLGMLRLQYVQAVELLCPLRAVFQHGPHGGIPLMFAFSRFRSLSLAS